MGGTEILKPLKKVYELEKIPEYLRQVFILTDGEVSNTDEIIGVTKAQAHEMRVFTLGIGNSASHHLVKGVAMAGGGTSTFVTDNEPIDRKVLEQLKDAIQPSLTNVQITWEGLTLMEEVEMSPPVVVNREKTLMGYGKPIASDSSTKVSQVKKYQQAPEKIPPIFDGSQLLIVGIFTGVTKKPTSAIITAESPDGPLSIKIQVSDSNNLGQVGIIHKLAAIKIVKEIDMKSAALSSTKRDVFTRLAEHEDIAKYKTDIIDIAVREGIASKYTSFIAVDNTNNEVLALGPMIRRTVPSQYPRGFPQSSRISYGSTPQGGITQMANSWNLTSFNCGRPSFNNSSKNQAFGFGSQQQQSAFPVNYPRFPVSKTIPVATSVGFGSVSLANNLTSNSNSAGLFGSSAAVSSLSPFSFGGTTFIKEQLQQQQQQQQPHLHHHQQEQQNQQAYYGFSGQSINNESDESDDDMSGDLFDMEAKSSGVTFGSSTSFNNSTIPETDKLYIIISFQSFDGSFNWDANLIQNLNLAEDSVRQEPIMNSWDLTAWATVLAITFLESRLADKRDSWVLVLMKASKWLTKNYATVLVAMQDRAQQLFTFS